MNPNMVQSSLRPAIERIVEPMIALARCSQFQRIIVTGAKSAELMFELHRHGYIRVAATPNYGAAAGQYDVALVDWRQRSVDAIETTLDWLADFLAAAGVLVIWLDPQQPAANRKLRAVLQRCGFLVEAGSVHAHGCAVSARRRETNPRSKVA
jgi:hypothetical protein